MIDPLDKATVKARLEDPAQRQACLRDLGAWVINTCLLAGAESATAFSVAGAFVRGIATSYDPPPAPIDSAWPWLRGGRYRRKKQPDASVPGEPGPDGRDAADH
jgi:hypothetical protein